MENLPQNPNQPEQYQVPPLEPTPTGLNQANHSSKKLLVSILILVALIGGYFALAKNQSWWPFRALNQNTNETINWQTYTNEEYGFEVRHPQDWTIEDTSSINAGTKYPGIILYSPS